MAVQINEVVIKASVTGNDCNNNNNQRRDSESASAGGSSQVSPNDVLELVEEVLTTKKER